MSKKLQLDIISDVMCPWCVVGYKNLEQAITELGLAEQIELEWQPFELNPDMPQEGENLRDPLAAYPVSYTHLTLPTINWV